MGLIDQSSLTDYLFVAAEDFNVAVSTDVNLDLTPVCHVASSQKISTNDRDTYDLISLSPSNQSYPFPNSSPISTNGGELALSDAMDKIFICPNLVACYSHTMGSGAAEWDVLPPATLSTNYFATDYINGMFWRTGGKVSGMSGKKTHLIYN